MFLSPVNHQAARMRHGRLLITQMCQLIPGFFFPPFESANSSVISAGGTGTCPGTLPADESQEQMLPSLRVSVNGSTQVKTVVSILDRLVLDEPPCLSRSREGSELTAGPVFGTVLGILRSGSYLSTFRLLLIRCPWGQIEYETSPMGRGGQVERRWSRKPKIMGSTPIRASEKLKAVPIPMLCSFLVNR